MEVQTPIYHCGADCFASISIKVKYPNPNAITNTSEDSEDTEALEYLFKITLEVYRNCPFPIISINALFFFYSASDGECTGGGELFQVFHVVFLAAPTLSLNGDYCCRVDSLTVRSVQTVRRVKEE